MLPEPVRVEENHSAVGMPRPRTSGQLCSRVSRYWAGVSGAGCAVCHFSAPSPRPAPGRMGDSLDRAGTALTGETCVERLFGCWNSVVSVDVRYCVLVQPVLLHLPTHIVHRSIHRAKRSLQNNVDSGPGQWTRTVDHPPRSEGDDIERAERQVGPLSKEGRTADAQLDMAMPHSPLVVPAAS